MAGNATLENTNDIINRVLNGERFLSINTDQITYNLDGKGMADWLTSCGYTVLSNVDTGTCGLCTLSNGVKVSTNGYCYL